MTKFKIHFPEEHTLDERSIRLVQGTTGLYFIFLRDIRIAYPIERSRLIYIGMSESPQNSIANRLRAHWSGQSGNVAIANYARRHAVRFTYHPLTVLKVLGTENLVELESFFLGDFLRKHGAYPLCNNQSGASFNNMSLASGEVQVRWSQFA